ncbi:hypothetical protein A2572_00880 [Candidatus Collierbacteria bacterium RIFOXYD1_FULL_40_9]|uniref:Uncharacterized protein n=1 Tax=Candidatus Collierbacteria bacterium RIFOXYD1_FULL_40_9 TaxID=1817731 RepID=A0A1F5FVW0_9BACT|nr:MAG: hypothetical protein A2572_00880 [Candidatus Collierbacteria bacterium RIFOXYD1_FULL_40_9]
MINIVKTTLAADTVVDIEAVATKGNFFGYTCIGHLVSNIAAAGFIVAGVITFLFLVWGGVDYLTSGGDKTKIENSQKRISSAIIGLAIIASSWAVYQIILVFFGVDVDKICSANPVG